MSATSIARARREFIRTHHPDVGGDPVTFAAGLAAFDADAATTRFVPVVPVVVVAHRRRRRRLARRLDTVIRRLPGVPRLPGARRLR